MKKLILILIICLFYSGMVYSLDISEVNSTTLISVASDSLNDPVTTITNSIADEGGNLIVAGITASKNAYLTKLDRDGNVKWDLRLTGSGEDWIENIIIDSENNIFIIGDTTSNDLISITNENSQSFGGDWDIFILKINSAGEILWGSYLGGEDKESFHSYSQGSLLVENDGLILWGATWSTEFPIENAFQGDFRGGDNPDISKSVGGGADNFVAKMSSDGEIEWSSYLGGSQYEYIASLKEDNNGDYVLIGSTQSEDFPVVPIGSTTFQGDQDGYISKIASDGKLMWSNYLGGSNREWTNQFLFDEINNLYVKSFTTSDDIIMPLDAFQSSHKGGWDHMLTKVLQNGTLSWNTYLGGSNADVGFDDGITQDGLWRQHDDFTDQGENELILDQEGNLILLSDVYSADIETVNAFQSEYGGTFDLMVSKFNQDGEVIFNSYFGGPGFEVKGQFYVDGQNNIIVTGYSRSDNLLMQNSYQPNHGGDWDVFILKLGPSGTIIFSTYFGGSDSDRLTGSFMDSLGNLFLVGNTLSEDFPTSDGSTHSGHQDIFIAKFRDTGTLEWSSLQGGACDDTLNRFSLNGDISGGAFVFGTSQSDGVCSSSENFDVGFISKYNAEGALVRSEFLGEIESPADGLDLTLVLIIIGGSILTSLLYFTRSFWFFRDEKFLLNDNIEEILGPLFNETGSLSYLFVGQSVIKDKNLEHKVRSTIPPEIFNYKFLFHPVKLSIIKLLYENIEFTTIQLRDLIGVSWTDFNTHLKALKKKEYVHVDQKFVDGSVRQVVSLKPHTINQFQILRELLTSFLDTAPNIDRYIELALEVPKQPIEGSLYPKN